MESTGAKLLAVWLDNSGRSKAWLAREADLSPSTIARLVRGSQLPQRRSAVAIQEATRGMVPVGVWPKAPIGRPRKDAQS